MAHSATCSATRVAAGRPDDQVGLRKSPTASRPTWAALRYFTTTTKSAQEIHELGPGRGAARGRVPGPGSGGGRHGRPGPDLRGDAHRPGAALHARRGAGRLEVAMQRAWDAMPEWFEVPPQAPCGCRPRRRARRRSTPARLRREPGRHLLHQRRRPRVVGDVRAGVDGLPRGDPGHPAAGHRLRAHGRPGVPQAHPHPPTPRGWGPHRAARGRDAALPGVRSTGSGCWPPTRCAPAAWWSTPGCTLEVEPQPGGRLHGRQLPLRASMRQPEVDRYVVSPGGRPAPTWSAGSRSSGCGPRRSSARATTSTSSGSTARFSPVAAAAGARHGGRQAALRFLPGAPDVLRTAPRSAPGRAGYRPVTCLTAAWGRGAP